MNIVKMKMDCGMNFSYEAHSREKGITPSLTILGEKKLILIE